MKAQIKNLVLSYGADLCGFADVSRFESAPPGFKPTDIYSDCKSVISLAVSLPKGLLKVDPRFIYENYFYSVSCPEVERISFLSAKKIEELFSCVAVPMPCNNAYEYWDDEKREGRGLISLKHAAVQAGLGSLGKNSIFITSQYGNLITLGAILTNLELEPDAMSEDICIKGCNLCVKACPVSAIENGTVSQKKCRENAYGKSNRGFETIECNKCRAVCPLNDMATCSTKLRREI